MVVWASSTLTASGINIPIAALSAESAFLLIVVVSLFAGDAISGEAGWGTLQIPSGATRYPEPASLLQVAGGGRPGACQPPAWCRSSVWWWERSPSAGILFRLPRSRSSLKGSAIGRLALSTIYVAWSQAAYLAFAFMLSTMTDAPFAAVAGGVGLGVVSQILNNISALNGTSYIYPTHYLNAWQSLFFQQGADLRHGARRAPASAVCRRVSGHRLVVVQSQGHPQLTTSPDSGSERSSSDPVQPSEYGTAGESAGHST